MRFKERFRPPIGFKNKVITTDNIFEFLRLICCTYIIFMALNLTPRLLKNLNVLFISSYSLFVSCLTEFYMCSRYLLFYISQVSFRPVVRSGGAGTFSSSL